MPTHSVHAFAEKVALVTDGANPVGRAVALQLALLGAFVIVGFSEASEAQKNALTELKSLGTLAHAVEIDISTAEGAKNLVAEVNRIFGRLDLLINTQKFESQFAFAEIGDDIWQKTLDANLKSVFFVTQAALDLMKPRPKPAIVNVITNRETDDKNPAFVAAQAGIISVTKQFAKSLPDNFRVNCVAVNEKPEEESSETDFLKVPNTVAPDDVARVVIFLLSPEAKALNDQILTVDRR